MNKRTPEQRAFDRIVYSIPPSQSDILLRAWGFDLRREYLAIICAASMNPESPVLELATGSGRMASVLARSGHWVISGDRDLDKHAEAMTRIGALHAPRVLFLRLDMESLPFPAGAIDTIVCMNTLHELARPRIGIDEIVRVHSGKGPLVLGDFNETGFDVMQQLHRLVYRNDHPRGHLPIQAARMELQDRYSAVREIPTPLNITLIATDRKNQPG